MKILICGDRNWGKTTEGRTIESKEDDRVKRERELIENYIKDLPKDTIIIEGEANGADKLSRIYAEKYELKVLKFPADWNKYGKSAGPIRNSEMLKQNPDLVVAFHNNIDESKGTKDTVTKAKKMGIKVEIKSVKESKRDDRKGDDDSKKKVTNKVCIKVDNLRKLNYANLEEWMKDKNNLYTGRRGRIFITEGKDKRIFHYKDSKWANPYKVTKDLPVEKSLKLYLDHIFDSELIYDIDELRGKNLGCFCKDGDECHAKLLSDILNHCREILVKNKIIKE